jgi:hypothetical protein
MTSGRTAKRVGLSHDLTESRGRHPTASPRNHPRRAVGPLSRTFPDAHSAIASACRFRSLTRSGAPPCPFPSPSTFSAPGASPCTARRWVFIEPRLCSTRWGFLQHDPFLRMPHTLHTPTTTTCHAARLRRGCHFEDNPAKNKPYLCCPGGGGRKSSVLPGNRCDFWRRRPALIVVSGSCRWSLPLMLLGSGPPSSRQTLGGGVTGTSAQMVNAASGVWAFLASG